MHGGDVRVQQAATRELAEDRHDPAGAMHVLDVVLLRVRRDLAQLRHALRQAVDVAHAEGHLGFLRRCEQVQDRVGRTPHRDVERHRILERLERRDATRQGTRILRTIPAMAQFHRGAPGLQEQLLAIRMRGQHGAIARQRQAQRFGQAVHRVRGEHAAAGTAGRAGAAFDHGDLFVGRIRIRGHHHRVDQVELVPGRGAVGEFRLARFHRSTGHEHRRDVEPQRRHQHARRDLVAIGDAHQRVRAMRVDHVLHRVGDDFARGQRIEHAVVAHRDAVVDRDGVELLGHAADAFDLARDKLPEVFQMHVARHELGE